MTLEEAMLVEEEMNMSREELLGVIAGLKKEKAEWEAYLKLRRNFLWNHSQISWRS